MNSYSQNIVHIKKSENWMCFDSTAMSALADSIIAKRKAQEEVCILNEGLSDCYINNVNQQSIIFSLKSSLIKKDDVIIDLHNNNNNLYLENQKIKKKTTIIGSVLSSIGAVLIAIIVIK